MFQPADQQRTGTAAGQNSTVSSTPPSSERQAVDPSQPVDTGCCWEQTWPELAMKPVGPLAARSPGFRLALEIERHRSANECLQGLLIDLLAFVNVDGPPDIPVKARIE